MIGTSIGRYQILEELGHGGMSVVYRGFDEDLERDVAVKVLHAHLAKKQENRLRLHREAKAIARLRHESILEIYDYAKQDAERAYIVMEYVDGQNLKQFLEALPHPPPAEICALIGLTLCSALACAHDAGIIHRDLKPENIMVSKAGVLKLMDFGIAHVFDAETMTQTGSLLGSPAHMAPEMIEGEKVDERADIFALGTVLYWLATGTLPFEGKNAPQILKRVLEGLFKNPEAVEPRVGQCFGDIIRRCMSYDIDERYATVREVAEALDAFLAPMKFAEPEAQLQLYLLQPVAEQETFERELIVNLQKQARQALERGNHTRAFRLFNRILAYEPDNQLVRNQLEKLQNRHQPVRVVALVAVALLAIGGIYVGFTTQNADAKRVEVNDNTAKANVTTPPENKDNSRAAAAAREAAGTLAAQMPERAMAFAAPLVSAREGALHLLATSRAFAASANERDAVAVNVRPPNIRENNGNGRRPETTPPVSDMGQASGDKDMGTQVARGSDQGKPPAAAETATYKIRLLPKAAQLSIDGGKPETIYTLHNGIELERGRIYKVRGTCNGCVTLEGTIDTSEPPPTDGKFYKYISLEWQNGIVQIKVDRPAVVYVDGDRGVARVNRGRPFVYEHRFGRAKTPTPPRKKVVFTIHDAEDMKQKTTLHVTLTPGYNETLSPSF